MFKRVGICLFRPSMIGMFFKDKYWIVISHLVVFMLAFVGCFIACSQNEKYFTSETIEKITSLVQENANEINIKYENNVLSGSEYKIKSDDFIAYFLDSGEKKTPNTVIMQFKETTVDMYYGNHLLKTYEYSKSSATNFEMDGVRNASVKDVIAFEALVSGALSQIDSRFMVLAVVSNIGSIIGVYFASMIFCVLFSFFCNPTIDMKIRIKLCIYCSLSYFVIWIFAILLNISFLQYIAFLLPLIYINIAFSHIIKVKQR